MSVPAGMDLSKVPLMPNPSGGSSNFVDPPSLHAAEQGSGITLIAISGIILTLRLMTNRKISRKFGLDDYLCVFAYIAGIGYWSLALEATRGSARHVWDVPVSVITVSYIKMEAAIQMVAAPAMWAAKAAILGLYIRVFGSVKWLQFTSYFLIALMALFYGSNIVIAAVYCVPHKGETWDGAAFQRCTKSAWSAVMIGVFAVVADLVIFLLPFPIVLGLRLNPAKKLGLVLVFLTAFILVVLSAIGLWLRVKIFHGHDPTWNGANLVILTFAEIFGTIMVSCTPALSAFWVNILVKSSLWSSLSSTLRFSSRQSQSSQSTLAENMHHQYNSTSNLKAPKYEVLEDDASTNSAGRRNDVFLSNPTSISLTSLKSRPDK